MRAWFPARGMMAALVMVFAPAVPAALETVTVQTETVERETVFDGSLEAVNQSTVSAQTSARVEEILFDVGDFVEKGAVIIRFRDSEPRARLESAMAGLREAQARLADARVNHDRVRDVYGRGLLPKAELDRAEADLKSALARVEAAQAAVSEAREGTEHTLVRAPYKGIVVQRHIETGETAVIGQPLMTGLSLEHLRAAVDIPQSSIGPLREHREARVILADGQSLRASGLRIPPSADPRTHTFRTLVSLPEGDHGVFPGTLVKVAFVSGTESALLVPPETVVRRSEVTGVYVVDDGGKVTFRYVRIGSPAADGRIPVLSGLEAGERVAIDPIAAGVEYRTHRGNP